jgi:hypothetical protein
MREGITLGWKAGLKCSTFYAVSAFLIIESIDQGIGFLRLASNLDKLVVTIFELAVISIATTLVAITPATILGALTGMCLGKFAEIANERISKYLFTLLCVLFCLTAAILIHLFFQIPITLSYHLPFDNLFIGIYETYPVSIGIPSVIYILTGGWVGWKLYSKASAQVDIQE